MSSDFVITDWSADNSVKYWLPWDIFGTIWKVFLSAFGGHLDHWNQLSIPGAMVWIKFIITMSVNIDTIIATDAINIDLILSDNEAYKQKRLHCHNKLCKQKKKEAAEQL